MIRVFQGPECMIRIKVVVLKLSPLMEKLKKHTIETQAQEPIMLAQRK
jgi:hypothetical protein